MIGLEYPFTPAPRVAVFWLPVREERGVRRFETGDWRALERFRPEALAGRFEDLSVVGESLRLHELALPRLSAPLLVFSQSAVGCMSEEQYRSLWRLFGLPLFEQIRDGLGYLVAQECDVRDGFHIVDARSELRALRRLPGPCACGRETDRVVFRGTAA
jgi:hypothetical protein